MTTIKQLALAAGLLIAGATAPVLAAPVAAGALAPAVAAEALTEGAVSEVRHGGPHRHRGWRGHRGWGPGYVYYGPRYRPACYTEYRRVWSASRGHFVRRPVRVCGSRFY